jgi:hypothetical protein
MKWVEFMQSYTFVLKHRLSKSNRVVDALSRRSTLLSTMTVEVIGLEEMKKYMMKIHIFLKHGKQVRSHGVVIELHTWTFSFKKDFYLKTISLCIPRDL